MSVIFSDAFTASLDGTNWTQQNGTWVWQAGGGGSVRNSVAGSPSILRTTTTAHAALADALATVFHNIVGADGGPLVRGTTGAGANNTCYYADADTATALAISVFRRITGSDTLVGSADGISVAANSAVALSATGTGGTVTLKKYYKGVQVSTDISDTNAARIVTSGQTGIFSWSTSVGTGSCDFDTFSVDDLVSARQWILTR